MCRTLRRDVSFLAFVVLAALVSSCSGAQKKEPIMTSEEFERNSPAPDDPCLGAKGAPMECSSQADCCKGYACSKDPERNPRSLYCIKE